MRPPRGTGLRCLRQTDGEFFGTSRREILGTGTRAMGLSPVNLLPGCLSGLLSPSAAAKIDVTALERQVAAIGRDFAMTLAVRSSRTVRIADLSEV